MTKKELDTYNAALDMIILLGREIVRNKSLSEAESKANGDLDRLVRRLTNYNAWRRGGDVGMPEPKDTGADIDAAIRIIDRVYMWSEFSDEEMRLHAGEMTAQEIRSVRAILRCICA